MIGGFVWLVFVLIAFGITIVVLGRLGVIALGTGRARLPRPEDTLRDRYARGEIGRTVYLEALTDLLKERYVRGELTAEEYEEQLGVVLGSVKSIHGSVPNDGYRLDRPD